MWNTIAIRIETTFCRSDTDDFLIVTPNKIEQKIGPIKPKNINIAKPGINTSSMHNMFTTAYMRK